MADLNELGINIPENNPSMESLVDSAFINQYTPPGYEQKDNYEQNLIDQQNKLNSPNEIGAQGMASLYPGIGQDINVGNYSGSIVGSNSIYVPTGDIMAIDPLLARRKAIDDAAKARAAQLTKPMQYKSPPKLSDQRHQEEFNKSFYNGLQSIIDEGKQKYGANFNTIASDRSTDLGMKLEKFNSNMEFLANNEGQIVKEMADLQKGVEDHSVWISDATRKKMQDFQNMAGDYSDTEKMSSIDLGRSHDEMVASKSFDDYISKPGFIEDFHAKIIESPYAKFDNGEYYDTRTKKRLTYDDQINLAMPSIEKLFKFEIQSGLVTSKELKDTLKSRLGNQTTIEGSINEKSTDAINRAGEINVPSLSQNGVFVPYQNTEEGKGVISINNYNNTGQVTFRALADYNMSISGKKNSIYITGTDGKPEKIDVNTLDLDNVQIFDDNKKVKQLPGASKVQMGEMSLLDDGTLVQKAKVFRPKTITVNDEGIVDPKGNRKVETFEVTDELILLQDEKGQGKSIISAIKSHMGKNTEAIKNYDEAVKKMEDIRKKEIGGKSDHYTSDQELGIQRVSSQNGVSRDEAIKALKEAGKL